MDNKAIKRLNWGASITLADNSKTSLGEHISVIVDKMGGMRESEKIEKFMNRLKDETDSEVSAIPKHARDVLTANNIRAFLVRRKCAVTDLVADGTEPTPENSSSELSSSNSEIALTIQENAGATLPSAALLLACKRAQREDYLKKTKKLRVAQETIMKQSVSPEFEKQYFENEKRSLELEEMKLHMKCINWYKKGKLPRATLLRFGIPAEEIQEICANK